MKLFIVGFIFMFVLSACSDSEEKYDEVLSYTEWHCNYAERWSRLPDEDYEFDGLDDVLSKLQSSLEKVDMYLDTIWDEHINITGDQWLIFGNESCTYIDERIEESGYVVNRYEVTKVYYPNQTYEEDLGNGYSLYVALDGEIISIVRKHFDYTEYDGKMKLDEPNVRYTEASLLSSEKFPYEKKETKQYEMSFERNGMSVILSGDLNITCFLNEDLDEISFGDEGVLYKEN